MRCPKCRYISFGTMDRCRNCGYDFSLVEDTGASLDLPIQPNDAPLGPLGELPLSADALEPARVARHGGSPGEIGKPAGRLAAAPRTDLPLFSNRDLSDDAPLVVPPAVPRPPLSVRKAGPRSRPDSPSDAGNGMGARSEETLQRSADAPVGRIAAADETTSSDRARVATLPRRATAGLIDLAILGSIDTAVVYLTLRVLGLDMGHLHVLPPVPLAAFLLLLNGGYLAIFTAAGGQTIGKMSTGIRVVPAAPSEGAGIRVALGTAIVRAAMYFASILPLGFGLLPILFTADRRALHDRLADTRVVPA